MDRHQFLRVLEQRQREGAKCPRFEWSFIPLAMFLGVLGLLQTSEIKDAFGTSRDVWHAFWIGALFVTAGATLALAVWWIGDLIWHWKWRKRTTPDDVVDEIIATMDRQDQEFEARQAAKRAAQ